RWTQRPSRTATPDTVASASQAPTNTAVAGSPLATSPIVNSWDRSPHSAVTSSRKLALYAAKPVRPSAICSAYSDSAAAVLARRAPRNMITAPVANRAAASSRTGVVGNSATRLPASTATAQCTANALATPSHTGNGRYRVVSTRVATKVLSGNSTGAIATNANPAEVSQSMITDLVCPHSWPLRNPPPRLSAPSTTARAGYRGHPAAAGSRLESPGHRGGERGQAPERARRTGTTGAPARAATCRSPGTSATVAAVRAGWLHRRTEAGGRRPVRCRAGRLAASLPRRLTARLLPDPDR